MQCANNLIKILLQYVNIIAEVNVSYCFNIVLGEIAFGHNCHTP